MAYVRRTPDGQVWLGEGVAINGHGEFLFPLDPAGRGHDGAAPTAFRGEVGLTAHAGALRLLIADPHLLADGTVTVRVSDQHTAPATRVPLARTVGPLSPSADVELGAVLTSQGADLFGGMYREGAELAPLALHLPVDRRPPPTDVPIPPADPGGTSP